MSIFLLSFSLGEFPPPTLSFPLSREEELGCEEDDGVGDLLQVREGEDGRGLHQRMRYNAAAAVVLHVL